MHMLFLSKCSWEIRFVHGNKFRDKLTQFQNVIMTTYACYRAANKVEHNSSNTCHFDRHNYMLTIIKEKILYKLKK